MSKLEMFFVLNGLVNGEFGYEAKRKFSEEPVEVMQDGWWAAPLEAGLGAGKLYHLTSAHGPYKNSREALAAIEFLEPYPTGISIANIVEKHLAKRGISPLTDAPQTVEILFTMLTELYEIKHVLKPEDMSDLFTDWDQRMADPDIIAEYI